MVIKESTTKTRWEWGDKAALAKLADISPQYLNDIIVGRKWPNHQLAARLAKASNKLGYYVTTAEWALPEIRRKGASRSLFMRGRK